MEAKSKVKGFFSKLLNVGQKETWDIFVCFDRRLERKVHNNSDQKMKLLSATEFKEMFLRRYTVKIAMFLKRKQNKDFMVQGCVFCF